MHLGTKPWLFIHIFWPLILSTPDMRHHSVYDFNWRFQAVKLSVFKIHSVPSNFYDEFHVKKGYLFGCFNLDQYDKTWSFHSDQCDAFHMK